MYINVEIKCALYRIYIYIYIYILKIQYRID